MRQYISTIPTDYLDAARVDGAGELAVFRKIVLPQCRPALITLSVLVALSSWDEFLWPLIVVGGRELARRVLPAFAALGVATGLLLVLWR